RRRDPRRAHRIEVPLRHAHGHPARRQARSGDDGLREAAMTKHEMSATFSRRALLQAGGALVVSIGAPVTFDHAFADDAMAIAAKPALTPDQLSSYIAINADGT